MKLHHCAFIIKKGQSATMQDFVEFLGAKLVWEGFDEGREIAMNFGNHIIQFSEKSISKITKSKKQETHIAFYSANPSKDLLKLNNWLQKRKIKTKIGKWNNKELWLDCPEIFENFVIEILNTK